MRFWDTSAIIPLLLSEPTSVAASRELGRDPLMVVWWATPVECSSALARQERDGHLDAVAASEARRRLAEAEAGWSEVAPVDRVRSAATRLLRLHRLRAGDALQLAAAIVAAEGETGLLPFVTLDQDLALAADREGFRVVRPGDDERVPRS